ncbi:MAG TPA: pantoate--beta-alanine ligase, partial [Spirochaetota bacterium]|nr:pantoate--beta-alanine ligase [Spirochaetota bacterium]
SIKSAVRLIESGEKNAKNIIDNVISEIKKIKTAKIDYVKIVDENMKDVFFVENGNILSLAVFFGKTRLIDNCIVREEICY